MSVIIEGDLIGLAEQGMFDVVVHGCNCQKAMGAGIAKLIKERWPEVYYADVSSQPKLGEFSSVKVTRNSYSFVVVNAYTQQFYGKGKQVDYLAIRQVFEKIAQKFSGKRIAYPKIGAGHGGGDWSVISQIINTTLKNEHHTLVILETNK